VHNRDVSPRVHAPSVTRVGERVVLPIDEGGHLVRVLRARVGDAVRVFNGRGLEFEARVESASSDRVELLTTGAVTPVAESATALTLAVALLKGDKMDDVVRDAVMLGVARVQPLVTAHAETTAAAIERGRRVERWTRIAVSSAKQCGRAVVPEVAAPRALEDVLAGLEPGSPDHAALIFVEPAHDTAVVPVSDLERRCPTRATVIVGPEGGWSSAELERAAGRCQFVSLGARTLRADAMPLAAVAALWTVWKAW
jgi:16S rRNA (uracil1498-N3)-methyltransferase